MLPIYICEDNKAELALIKDCISNYLTFKYHEDTHKIITFTNPLDFLEEYRRYPQTGIYFIDYHLGEAMNGAALAKEIRSLDPVGYVIFVTTHEECMPLVLNMQINTLDFIMKDSKDFAQQIYSVLDTAFSIYDAFTHDKEHSRNYLYIKTGTQNIPVFCNDIAYIEVSSQIHKLLLKTISMRLDFYGSLDKIYDSLNSDMFIKCSRSAIINYKFVQYVDKTSKTIVMTDGHSFTYSRRNTGQILGKLSDKIKKTSNLS